MIRPGDQGEQGARIALTLFVLFFIFRFTRTFVSIWTFLYFPASPMRADPTYTIRDVSVVVPTTFKTPEELAKCLKNIIACEPAKIFVVTSEAKLKEVEAFCNAHGFNGSVKCLTVKKLNKRKQILAALQHVRTDIVAFADDDVFWPNTMFLDYMLALFEDPKVGAGGPRQRVRRSNNPNGWWFLGCSYLERRVWNNLSTQGIDGSISTLSGRTSLYRTSILRTQEFFHFFQTDAWRGRKLNSDDDKALTRYVFSHGWEIGFQGDERATIETTLEEDSKFLAQCLRWARARFRGNLTTMQSNDYWCSLRYCWGLYVIYITQFFQFAILNDAALMGLLVYGLGRPIADSKIVIAALGAWILFSKVLKLIPHFMRHPRDMKFIPLSIAFSYFHTFLNLYAFCTLTKTAWGSQKIAGEDEQDEYIKLEEEDAAGEVLIEELAVVCENSNDHLITIDDGKDKFLPTVDVVELSDDDDY